MEDNKEMIIIKTLEDNKEKVENEPILDETNSLLSTEAKTEVKAQENYDTLKAIIEAMSNDFNKFENKKVKVAGQRVRNNLLNAKKLCDTIRKQIMTDMRGLPTKHRIEDIGEDYPIDSLENSPPSEREMMGYLGELDPVITKKIRKPRKANKAKAQKKEVS